MPSLLGHGPYAIQKPPAGSQIDWGYSLASDLIAFWPGLEGSGFTTFDAAGGRQMTFNGAAAWLPALGQGAQCFNHVWNLTGAAGCYMEALSSTAYDIVNGTWSGWIKTSQSAASFPLIAARAGNTSLSGISIFISTTNLLRVQVRSSSTLQLDITGGPTMNDGKWHHWGFSFGQASGAPGVLYVDGKNVVSGTMGGAWLFNSQVFRLGIALDPFWTPFIGQMQGPTMHKRVLAQADIQKLVDEPFAMLRGPDVWRRTFIMGGGIPPQRTLVGAGT